MSRFDPREYRIALQEPRALGDAGAWIEHIPFAFVLIDLLRPATVVELGTHWGDSYMAFCQTIDTLKIETKAFAVDTWRGDAQAGLYGDHVLIALKQNHDAPYGKFSTLMQMTFDEAHSKFSDGSVDLLHIDGLHTYEAVRHDFESWLPKMSARGVIIFHDTAVRLPGYGVHQLWSEISAKWPSFEFPFGNGLGVLAVGPEVPERMRKFIDIALSEKSEVVEYFGRLGTGIKGRMMFETLARRVLTVQGLLNQWWQALGVAVKPGTEPGYLVGSPWSYGDRTIAELQQLANADLQLRQQVSAAQNAAPTR